MSKFQKNLDTFSEFVKDVMTTNERERGSKDGETRFYAETDFAEWNNAINNMLDWTYVKDLPVLGEAMLEHYLNVYNVCSGGVYALNRMYTKIQELVIQDFVRLLWEVGTGERLEAIAQFEGDWKV